LIAFSVKRSNIALGTNRLAFCCLGEIVIATLEWKECPCLNSVSKQFALRNPEYPLITKPRDGKLHIILAEEALDFLDSSY
jgi:hypothetical protein